MDDFLQILRLRSDGDKQLNYGNIVQKDFNNIVDMNRYVEQSPSLCKFIVFISPSGGNSMIDLEFLKGKEEILAIFISVNNIKELLMYDNKVIPVLKEVIEEKIKFRIIKCLLDSVEKLKKSNKLLLALNCIREANMLKNTHFRNRKIQYCHILIIPLNTTDEYLIDYQERVICLCKALFSDYEIIVCTIYDFISFNATDDFSMDAHAAIFRTLVITCSPIRFYLVGNEDRIINSVCKYFFQHESHDTAGVNYDKAYTLVENQPIGRDIMSSLNRILPIEQKLMKPIKLLREIKDDIKFVSALEEVDANLDGRRSIADIRLREYGEANPASGIEVSEEYHLINQPMLNALHYATATHERDITECICETTFN